MFDAKNLSVCLRTGVNTLMGENIDNAVADPGFPIGGAPTCWGVCRPPMRTLFSENVCENERNGSCWGGGGARRRRPLDPPM